MNLLYHLQITPEHIQPGDSVSIQVEVENTGQRPGDEVVQLYVKDVAAALPVPRLQLQGFVRLRLAPADKQTVQFNLTPEQLSLADDNGQWVLKPGEFKIWVGGQQPNLKSSLQPDNVVAGQFIIQA